MWVLCHLPMLPVNSFLLVIFLLLLRVFFWGTYLDFYIPSALSPVIGFKLFTEAPPPAWSWWKRDQFRPISDQVFFRLSSAISVYKLRFQLVGQLFSGSLQGAVSSIGNPSTAESGSSPSPSAGSLFPHYPTSNSSCFWIQRPVGWSLMPPFSPLWVLVPYLIQRVLLCFWVWLHLVLIYFTL